MSQKSLIDNFIFVFIKIISLEMSKNEQIEHTFETGDILYYYLSFERGGYNCPPSFLKVVGFNRKGDPKVVSIDTVKVNYVESPSSCSTTTIRPNLECQGIGKPKTLKKYVKYNEYMYDHCRLYKYIDNGKTFDIDRYW